MGRRPGSKNKHHITSTKINISPISEVVNKYTHIDIYFHERFKGWSHVTAKLVENNMNKIVSEVYSCAETLRNSLSDISSFDLANALVVCEANEYHIINIPISTFKLNDSVPKIITNDEARKRKDVLVVR